MQLIKLSINPHMKAHLLYRITNSLTDLSWRIPAPVLNGSLKVCESQTDSQNFKKKATTAS